MQSTRYSSESAKMKKILYGILAVLLVVALLTGVTAAFTVESSSVNPNGALSPGDSVTAVAKISIKGGTGPSISLASPLTNPAWHINIMRGSVRITETGGSGKLYSISSWSLNYDEDIALEISMTGVVGNDLAGKSVIVMTITQDGGKSDGGAVTYSSPAQSVYNPAEVNSKISSLRDQIKTLKEQALLYANSGINVDSGNNSIASAESYLSSAESYGTKNLKAAFAAISNAETAVKNAGREISGAALAGVNSNIAATEEIIATLIEKGKTNEANIISTNLMEVRSDYNALSAEYKNGAAPDCGAALTKSGEVLASANDFLVKAEQGIDILKYWWVLLIVLGVAVVVVGVVLIIRRRGSGWDELG